MQPSSTTSVSKKQRLFVYTLLFSLLGAIALACSPGWLIEEEMERDYHAFIKETSEELRESARRLEVLFETADQNPPIEQSIDWQRDFGAEIILMRELAQSINDYNSSEITQRFEDVHETFKETAALYLAAIDAYTEFLLDPGWASFNEAGKKLEQAERSLDLAVIMIEWLGDTPQDSFF
jgi:hypothetical protein